MRFFYWPNSKKFENFDVKLFTPKIETYNKSQYFHLLTQVSRHSLTYYVLFETFITWKVMNTKHAHVSLNLCYVPHWNIHNMLCAL
jgi:hypothetical protein